MRTRPTYKIGLAVAASAVIAGCAQPTASEPAGSAPTTSESSAGVSTPREPSAPPSRVAEPPREPGDQAPSTGWVTGMVTVGGSGPCYGLVADDGKRYALYATGGLELQQGSRVRVLLEPTMLRIYCGPGSLMAMTDMESVK